MFALKTVLFLVRTNLYWSLTNLAGMYIIRLRYSEMSESGHVRTNEPKIAAKSSGSLFVFFFNSSNSSVFHSLTQRDFVRNKNG